MLRLAGGNAYRAQLLGSPMGLAACRGRIGRLDLDPAISEKIPVGRSLSLRSEAAIPADGKTIALRASRHQSSVSKR